MATVVVTPPTAEPIDLEDVKAHLNIINEDHDAYLQSLIASARVQCETICHQTVLATTFEDSFETLSGRDALLLERGPVTSVTSVVYTDADGAEQTLATSEYQVKTDGHPAEVLRGYGKTWPTVRRQGVARPVVVRYVAGYATPDDVPAPFKQAMLLLIGHWWMMRESVAQVNFTEVPMSSRALLSCLWAGDYP